MKAVPTDALFDGWFWLANLVEYVELSYRRWRKTGNPGTATISSSGPVR